MRLEDVDAKMKDWRQGDVVLGLAVPFVSFAHSATPVSRDARLQAEGADQTDFLLDVMTDVPGFAVLSQTCDIVRDSERRPYVEVAPLIASDTSNPAAFRKSTHRAYVPALEAHGLVADLDRVMVIEKPLLAALPPEARIIGCPSEDDRRRFAEALARKHLRFAFPDDFNKALARISQQVTKRHGKDSPMGNFLGLTDDIRAYSPDWDAAEPNVLILFVFPEAAAIPDNAQKLVDELIDRFVPTGAFKNLRGQAVAYDTMTAARYRETDSLDFDHLSSSSDRPSQGE
ncbi:hypothetical protein [Allosphingosinicella deserti]|uniref:Uncharacterized protein n=1 Tax=Allosphingosinicella deserti TaxID=2116704 RepID=A0A2P7QE85_9SPHN|nr:hypothetical protein [Sphingomonas deserti]PSJ36283.1 hypothetical protein C7I55_26680 [Sphingomonas deserti]